jgi:hypothetical protein
MSDLNPVKNATPGACPGERWYAMVAPSSRASIDGDAAFVVEAGGDGWLMLNSGR